MATINITHEHSMTADQLKCQLDHLAEEMLSRHQLKSQWQADGSLCLSRRGVQASIANQGTRLVIIIKLGLMLAAFKKTIEQEIVDFLTNNIH